MQLNMDKNVTKETNLVKKYIVLNQPRKASQNDNAKEPKKLLNIINVYAPTTILVKQDVKLLDQMYNMVSSNLNNFEEVLKFNKHHRWRSECKSR